MKPIIRLVAVATMLLFTMPKAKALFGHVAAERERRIEAQQQLTVQEAANRHLYLVISILSAGVVTSLVIGAAVGSKTKEDHAAKL